MLAWLYKFPLRLRSLFRRSQVESDLADEFAFHVAMQQKANLERGLSPEEARRAALAHFGSPELQKERCRDTRGLAWADHLRQDLLYTSRNLRRHPTFTAVALLSLALGIGANAAIFSVVNSVLFHSLSFPDPARVMVLQEARNGRETGGNPPRLYDWEQRVHSFRAVAGFYPESVVRTGSAEPEQLQAIRACGNFFAVAGLPLAAGRAFTDAEIRQGARIAVISRALGNRLFGGAKPALGRALTLGGVHYDVVGVMPPGDYYPTGVDVWTPMPVDVQNVSRNAGFLTKIARLQPGVSREHAEAELRSVAAGLARQYPASDAGLSATLVRLDSQVTETARPSLLILAGAVGFVLLVACANVAGMLLSRAAGRQRESAIRISLGAGAGRLFRMFLTESVVLGLLGGALGLLIAPLVIGAIALLLPADVPGLPATTLNWPTAFAAFALSLVCGLLAGAAPAWQASHSSPVTALKQDSAATSGVPRMVLRRGLVIAEVAASLVLLIGAGLLARSLMYLSSLPLGFQPDHTLTVSISFPWDTPPARLAAFYQQTLDRLSALPGVRSVGMIDRLPLSGGTQGARVVLRDRPLPGNEEFEEISWRATAGDYFAAAGYPLIAGHPLPVHWSGGNRKVTVVNQAFARRFFPDESPLGRFIAFNPSQAGAPKKLTWFEVTGIVGDVPQQLGHPVPPEVYVSAGNTYWPLFSFVLRAQADPRALASAVRNTVHQIDPNQMIDSIGSMDQRLEVATAKPRTQTWLLGGFALVSLLLASIGVYGLVASDTLQRRREIGVRMALGADRANVLSLMLRRGLALVAAGIVLGLAGAWWLSRFLSSLLFGIAPADPIAFTLAASILFAVAAVAILIPVTRASRLDPLTVLRHE